MACDRVHRNCGLANETARKQPIRTTLRPHRTGAKSAGRSLGLVTVKTACRAGKKYCSMWCPAPDFDSRVVGYAQYRRTASQWSSRRIRETWPRLWLWSPIFGSDHLKSRLCRIKSKPITFQDRMGNNCAKVNQEQEWSINQSINPSIHPSNNWSINRSIINQSRLQDSGWALLKLKWYRRLQQQVFHPKRTNFYFNRYFSTFNVLYLRINMKIFGKLNCGKIKHKERTPSEHFLIFQNFIFMFSCFFNCHKIFKN